MIEIKKFDTDSISKKILTDWNYILDNSKNTTIFQTPEWVKFMISEINVLSEVLIAYDFNEPVGLFHYYLKKGRFFLMKYSTGVFESPYGGPITIDSTKEEVQQLLLEEVEKNLRVSRTAITLPPNSSKSALVKLKYQINPCQSMLLDLGETEEDLWSGLHKTKRRNINKAKKNGVKIVEGNLKDLPEFHELLGNTYQRLGLKEPKPLSFYKNLFILLSPLGRIKFFLAEFEGQRTAAVVMLLYKNSMIFWQGAAYKEFMNLGVNDLLHWHAICFAKENGLDEYNLLHYHDAKGVELESLKRFKEGFGASNATYYATNKQFGFKSKWKYLISLK